MIYRTLPLSWGHWSIIHYSYPEVTALPYTTAIFRSPTCHAWWWTWGQTSVPGPSDGLSPLWKHKSMFKNLYKHLRSPSRLCIFTKEMLHKRTNANSPSRCKDCLNNSRGCMNVHCTVGTPHANTISNTIINKFTFKGKVSPDKKSLHWWTP